MNAKQEGKRLINASLTRPKKKGKRESGKNPT
jgi:hypothetical protein